MNFQTQVQVPSRDAGRALDALVAEKVMGYRWRAVKGMSEPLLETPDGLPAALRYDNGELHESETLPRYSTDIAAAWLVVERLAARGLPGHVGSVMLHSFRACALGEWEAAFCSDFGYTPATKGSTAPLAICRAALLAVEATP